MLGEHLPLWLKLVIQFINFGILVFVLMKFGGKPFKDYLKKRHDTVKEKIDEAERLLKEAEQAKAVYEGKLAGVDSEIQAFRASAMEAVEAEKTRVIQEAESLAKKIREQAQLAYDQEMRTALEKIRMEVAERTISMATQKVRDSFGPDDHNRMLDEFIQKVRSTN
jgi:F-type H+-transporting ATPase subunit b